MENEKKYQEFLNIYRHFYKKWMSLFGVLAILSFAVIPFLETPLFRMMFLLSGIIFIFFVFYTFVNWQKKISFVMEAFTDALVEEVSYEPKNTQAVCFASFEDGIKRGWIMGASKVRYNNMDIPGSVFLKEKEYVLYGIYLAYPNTNSVKFGDLRYDFRPPIENLNNTNT